jgi:hypothetical protein
MNARVYMPVKGRMYVSMFRAPAMGWANVNSEHGKRRPNAPSKPTRTRLPLAAPFSEGVPPWGIRLQRQDRLGRHRLVSLPSSSSPPTR